MPAIRPNFGLTFDDILLTPRYSAVVVLQDRTSAHGLRLSRVQVRANREQYEACTHPTRHRLLIRRRLGLQQK